VLHSATGECDKNASVIWAPRLLERVDLFPFSINNHYFINEFNQDEQVGILYAGL
jgi:hypothetical protein